MDSEAALVQPKASRGVLIAMRVLTIFMALVWVFFGTNWLRRTPEVLDAINHLGYPLYITSVIGMTHILGGLGLLIPNRPRLSQWVFAGLTYDLILAAISHLASHDIITNALHPIVLIVFLAVLIVLRDRTGDNLWSSK
jgi:uncharacterized membrane protein YphA (DoxX/SURF4 family)